MQIYMVQWKMEEEIQMELINRASRMKSLVFFPHVRGKSTNVGDEKSTNVYLKDVVLAIRQFFEDTLKRLQWPAGESARGQISKVLSRL